tara:strand:+ start:35366 stop:35695 length:330 start_codon:yes stop_codon:yes gene_type:complete
MTASIILAKEPLFDVTVGFRTEDGDFNYERMDDISLSKLQEKITEDDNRPDEDLTECDYSFVDQIYFHNTQRQVKTSDIRQLSGCRALSGFEISSSNSEFLKELNKRYV